MNALEKSITMIQLINSSGEKPHGYLDKYSKSI